MGTSRKSIGEYIWVRVSFSRSDILYSIPNCYAKIWVPQDTDFPPGDRFLKLEDVVLPLTADEPKRTTREGTNLVALRNMPRTFPGSNGSLYINQFQVASIMPLDPQSSLIQDLQRITHVLPVGQVPDRRKEGNQEKQVVALEGRDKS